MLTSPLINLRATFFARERLVPGLAAPVHGLVLDVPMGHSIDTLAAYADGSARYINHTGKTILWDLKGAENPMRPLIDRLLAAGAGLDALGAPAPWGAAPDSTDIGQATILTPDGLVTRALGDDDLAKQLVGHGAALMRELIARTQRPAAATAADADA